MWKAVVNKKIKTKSTGTAEDGATIEVQESANVPKEKDDKISYETVLIYNKLNLVYLIT